VNFTENYAYFYFGAGVSQQLKIVKRGGHGGLRLWLIFLCGVAVNTIPVCGVAVISNLTVSDVSVFNPVMYGELKLFAVSRLILFSR